MCISSLVTMGKETRVHPVLNATAEVCKKCSRNAERAVTRFSVHKCMCPRWWSVMVKKMRTSSRERQPLQVTEIAPRQGRAECVIQEAGGQCD